VDQRRLGALGKATFAVAAWGASFVATKVALRELSPLSLVWIRFAMGVAVLGVFVLARGQMARVPARELGYFALLGFIGITFHQWLQSNGLVTAEATTTGWIIASIPLFIAILGAIALGERLGSAGVAGILIAAVGVLLVVSRGDLAALSLGRIGAKGDVLILLSAPNWAIYTVLSRHGLTRHPAARMMFYVMSFGWIFTTLLFAGESGHAWSRFGALTPHAWVSVAFLGVVCSGVAYVFWYDALERVTASEVGALLYLEPLVTVAVAAVVLREPIRFPVLLGGAIILAGIWLVNRRRA
jgi:drug/metabolite transporter (DMT)-like permease